jgi:carboxylate-amine ligase
MARTVGVEEEFLLVGVHGPELSAVGADVAASAARRSAGRFEHELKKEQTELGTEPCQSVLELRRQLRDRRATLTARARAYSARLAALATSPVPGPTTTTADQRYARMSEIFGPVAEMQLTCGMHVHVSIDSADEGVGVLDRIRAWLPSLLALSANSPFWQGKDTGYASYRTVVWGQWPTAGATELFGDVAGYQRVSAQLLASGAALDVGMLYFDARLSGRYPTVEVRVADVSPYADDAAVIAALTRALVTTAAADWAEGRPPVAVRSELLRAAKWKAARWGLQGELIDPLSAEPVPAWALIDALLERIAGALSAAGDTRLVETGLSAIRDRGNGAELQRRAFAVAESFDEVVAAVVAETAR